MAESRTTVTVHLLEGRRELRTSGRVEGERAEEGGEGRGEGRGRKEWGRMRESEHTAIGYSRGEIFKIIF